jgi:hypothetical protein
MRKAYLFIYNDATGTRADLKAILDSMKTVKTWRYDMPHLFYLISENSAAELAAEFALAHGTAGQYLFVECSENKQGRMLKDSWYLLNHKVHKPKE